jgi:hypothetical protein
MTFRKMSQLKSLCLIFLEELQPFQVNELQICEQYTFEEAGVKIDIRHID